MLTFFFGAGLALALVLLVGIRRRLDGLPLAVWALAKKEREMEAPKALDMMKEAVAVKAGAAVIAIQRYEENSGASFRAQVAEAETRARVSERRAADVATVLQTATALVRELRAMMDAALEPRATRILPPSMPPAQPGDAERETGRIPVPRASIEEEDLDDEKTRVDRRPCLPPPSGNTQGRPGNQGGAA